MNNTIGEGKHAGSESHAGTKRSTERKKKRGGGGGGGKEDTFANAQPLRLSWKRPRTYICYT